MNNRVLAISCMTMMECIQQRIEKELRIKFSSIQQEVLPILKEDENFPRTQSDIMTVLSISTQKKYLQIGDALQKS